MSIGRIKTVLLHTWFHFTHSMETWVDLFWNSTMQMLVFSFIALAMGKGVVGQEGLVLIVGMIFWNIIWVGQYSVTVGVLWEIWSKSFSSLFITPLSFHEFLMGQLISGFIKALAAFIMAAIIGYLVYGFSVLSLGLMLPLYFMILLVFSWGVGFLVLSLILRYGTDIQSLSWAFVFLVQPFGGVFYSASVLPIWLRWISLFFPSTFLFEAMRYQLTGRGVAWPDIGLATLTSIIWFFGSFWVLGRTLHAAKVSGSFARMEG